MAQQLGRSLLIKIGDGGSPSETFTNLCGFRARSFNLSANPVDTTVPDCATPSNAVQRTTVPGIVNREFSGSGLFDSDAASAVLMGHVNAATVFNAQVIVPGYGTYEGSWMCSNFEFSGEMEGNMEFTATFMAADALTFTAE